MRSLTAEMRSVYSLIIHAKYLRKRAKAHAILKEHAENRVRPIPSDSKYPGLSACAVWQRAHVFSVACVCVYVRTGEFMERKSRSDRGVSACRVVAPSGSLNCVY